MSLVECHTRGHWDKTQAHRIIYFIDGRSLSLRPFDMRSWPPISISDYCSSYAALRLHGLLTDPRLLMGGYFRILCIWRWTLILILIAVVRCAYGNLTPQAFSAPRLDLHRPPLHITGLTQYPWLEKAALGNVDYSSGYS